MESRLKDKIKYTIKKTPFFSRNFEDINLKRWQKMTTTTSAPEYTSKHAGCDCRRPYSAT